MEFPKHIDTICRGLSIVYFKASQVEISKLGCIFVPECCFNLSKQCILLHVIWVYTVGQSTHLGVSGIQRVKIKGTLSVIYPTFLLN